MNEMGRIENDVLIGRNDYLFLAGGAHHVMEIVTGSIPIDAKAVAIFEDNIQRRKSWADSHGAKYLHIIFPDKQSIIPEQWPLRPPIMMGQEYLKACKAVSGSLLYPMDLLAAQSGETVSSVDTHLTAFGSILVAANVVERLVGPDTSEIAQSLFASLDSTVEKSGDLGSKLVPARTARERVSSAQYPGTAYSNNVPGGNNGIIDIRFSKSAPLHQRVLIFGDSFGRDLAYFLSYWFRETLFLRSPFFHDDIAAQYAPDILITENIERYLNAVESDESRPLFWMYPYLNGYPAVPTTEFAAALSATLSYPRKPYHDFFGTGGSDSGADRAMYLALKPWPQGKGQLAELEAPEIIERNRPSFVCNLSSAIEMPLLSLQQDLHGSYLVNYHDVEIFGPGLVVDATGAWTCESRAFKDQFIKLASEPGYDARFPGRKARIRLTGDRYEIERMQPSDFVKIDEDVFLGTPLEPDNWGRWIISVIPKIAYFHRFGKGRKFFCRARHDWQKSILKMFDLSEDQLLDHDPGRSFRIHDVMCVEYNVSNVTVSRAERRLFDEVVRAHGSPRLPDRRRIFVSRLDFSRRNPWYRVLQNEADLIAAVERLDFTIIQPEQMTLSEQIAAFANADLVVALGGAALYNCVFCSPTTKVVTIESSDYFVRPHAELLGSLGLAFGIVIGNQDPTDPEPVHKRWTIDIPEAIEAIQQFA